MSTPSSLEPAALWRLRAAPEGAEAALAASGRFAPLTRRLLAARGIADAASAAAFLDPAEGLRHAPGLLPGMEAAVARLAEAWRRGEKVAVFGDYDVDGVTSTVLLAKLFGLLKLTHELYLPDRIREGYGPNVPALQALRDRGASVVVTVDCGTGSVAEAAAARAMGLDLIITDHHLPSGPLPAALALVNPQAAPGYPYAMLGGVGVAYKLAQALLEALDHPRREEFLDHMLELVALGTVCDVAPLDGENRSLVRDGLQRLRRGRWLGLRCLAEAAGVDLAAADAGTLGYALGPRLNAGGRVGDAMLGVRLLLGKDGAECRALAGRLDAANRERQALEKGVVEQALRAAEAPLARGAQGLVLWDEAWHPGVVGLAASRLLERFGRPVFVFGVAAGLAKGSGRARRPFNLVQALGACAPLLLKHGGHAAAAGATADPARLPEFAEAFAAQAAPLEPADLRPTLDIDLEARLDEVSPAWMDELRAFEPHGARNPRPLFIARGLRLGRGTRAVGAEGAHLKLTLDQGRASLGGIAFRQGARLGELGQAGPLDAAFHLSWNTYNGTRSIQLDVRDLRSSAP